MLSEQQQRIMGYFIEEAKDHLNTIEQGLLNLQSTIADSEMINEVFRAAHSVKGGAAMLGLNSIQQTSHRLEDYFKVLRECPIRVDQRLETLFLRVFDTLQELLEQLQGPFGLTEDKAAEVMADVEPVFAALHEHLNVLVTQSGGVPPEDVDLGAKPVSLPSPAPVQAAQAVPDEESALRLIFQSDVPGHLREMLQLFKQPDDASTRQQLHDVCQDLVRAGEQFDLPKWCDLMGMAQQAIASADNTYRTLAPILIKEIKQAQEQVLANRSDEICCSEKLQELLPVTAAGLGDIELEDLFAVDEMAGDGTQADLLQFDLGMGADDQQSVASSTQIGDEAGSDDWFDQAMDDTSSQDNDFDFSSLPGGYEVEETEGNSFSDSLFGNELGLDMADEPSFAAPQSGPEVGTAELNSLADLFEGDVPELGINWQEATEVDDFADVATDSPDVNSSSDFADLFGDQSEGALTDIDSDDDDLSALLNISENWSNESDALAMSASDMPDLDMSDLDMPDLAMPEATPADTADNDLSDLLNIGGDWGNDSDASAMAELDIPDLDMSDLDMPDLAMPEATPADTADNDLSDLLNIGGDWGDDSDASAMAELDMPDLAMPEASGQADNSFDLDVFDIDEPLGHSTEPEHAAGQFNDLSDLFDDADVDLWASQGEPQQADDMAPTPDSQAEDGIEELSASLGDEDTELFNFNILDLEPEEDISASDSPWEVLEDLSDDSDLTESLLHDFSNDLAELDGTEEIAAPETLDPFADQATADHLPDVDKAPATDNDFLTPTAANPSADSDVTSDLWNETFEPTRSRPAVGAAQADLNTNMFEAFPESAAAPAQPDRAVAEPGDEDTFGQRAFDPSFETFIQPDIQSELMNLDLQEESATTDRDADRTPEPSHAPDLEASSEFTADSDIRLDADFGDNLAGLDDLFAEDVALEMPDFEGPSLDESLEGDIQEDISSELSAVLEFSDQDLSDDNASAADFGNLFEPEAQDNAAEEAFGDWLTLESDSDDIEAEADTSADTSAEADTGNGFSGLFESHTVEAEVTADDDGIETSLSADQLDNLFDLQDVTDTSPDDAGLSGLWGDDAESGDSSFDFDLAADLAPDLAADRDNELLFADLGDGPDAALEELTDTESGELDFGAEFESSSAAMDDNEPLFPDDEASDLGALFTSDDEASNLGALFTSDDDETDLTDLEVGFDFSSLDEPVEAAAETAEVTDSSFELDDLSDLDDLLADDTAAPAIDLELAAAVDHDQTSEPTDDHSLEDFSDLEALLADDLDIAAPSVRVEAVEPEPELVEEEDEFDDLEKLLEDADQTLGGPPTAKGVRRAPLNSNRGPTRRSTGVLSNQTMRVSVKHLDNLNNLVGELVVNRNSLEQAQDRLRQFLDNLLYQVQQLSDVGQRMRDLYERSLLESSLLSSRKQHHHVPEANHAPVEASHSTGVSFDALEMDRFTGFHTLSQEMIELIVRVRESASDIDFVVDETDQVTRIFRQITTQLQEGLTRSRMVPFAQAADRLPRAVRDISIKCGKQAELAVEGRDTLIDKMILEQLYDPMTHLVNNAITHGIETPEERQAAGKPPVGRITVRTFHQGNQTVISVIDDGAGIDPDLVKAKAVEKGLITAADAKEMTRLDIYDLLFHHGFSTKDKADDYSGRGVGMDVVRTSLNEIRGVINIDSTVGQGTTFTIRLPLTLSISKALCCISNRARIAFPMDGVEDMLDVPHERVQTDEEGRSCIFWRDTLLPFQPLAELLKYNRVLGRGSVYGGNQEEDIISVVVLRSAGNYLALQVDQVLGEQEIVIKQLEGPVPKPVGIAGATVLGDGRIMPIADVLELIDLSMGRIRREAGSSLWDKDGTLTPVEPAAIKTEPTVLIVDDSITVRELLSMTFNKIGYRVEQARDGQEAWEKLRSGLPCDLVFCDIEMPRMDGLELLSRMQKDPLLSPIPIAMLTSRGADRHRQMAVQLGAKGYFTKPYLEEALLDAAQRMLKGEVLVGRSS